MNDENTNKKNQQLMNGNVIKIALPKGRLMESTKELLEKSKIFLSGSERNYKPESNISEFEFRILKPRNIPKMVEEGLVDVGIIGLDLVEDENASVEFILDLKTMPVFLMVAAPKNFRDSTAPKTLTVASEYTEITKGYFRSKNKKFRIIKTYGSTECFVPEFADVIVDHTQSGRSLKQNNLKVLDVIMKSTTRLIANSKLEEQKLETVLKLKKMLSAGLKKMNLNYSEFLTEEQIRTNNF
ncbi:ATP phosphoribosyltransferase [Candidatus Woesearchaeota archaeon]|jgi:ATP phosphoribosyltransferase|nr:ATP phosphoribosyltransferase [Candidatus Woesearchaeota archaeon]MBT6518909.1 ATP phosphoribosyltransferase [Candidatus Woesearchaeota archaeon]MBT7367577.1 ATP phosphoribosyltransferase [Candidatus Woesearchaeota archaeon]